MASASLIVIRGGLVLAAIGVLGYAITLPKTLDLNALAGFEADVENGARVFAAMGCGACHSAPDGVEYEGGALGGGKRFPSDFGTFIAPNISMHRTAGIGNWNDLDIANAVQMGTSPKGEHYYPAFPYASFNKAEIKDVFDMIAHLRTLPATDTPSRKNEVSFPFNLRMALGGWKLLFVNRKWVVKGNLTVEQEQGRYLVEALGHCGECHTPRNILGGTD